MDLVLLFARVLLNLVHYLLLRNADPRSILK